MSNNRILWWGLLVTWIAGSTYWHVCKIKNLCDTGLIASTGTIAEVPSVIPLVIADKRALMLRSKGNFAFALSGIIANKSTVGREIDSLVKYVKANPDKLLAVIGNYSAKENNTTTFANLGLARASGIKNWLLTKGLTDSNVLIKSRINENLNFYNDSLSGGIDFKFVKKMPNTVTELANEQKFETIFKPLDLYFPTASADYIKTDQNQKFILETKKYFSINSIKKLIITGHTDNEDSTAWNLALSIKRANVVKKQFVLSGISANRIIAIGKGEAEPKASNGTPEGRRANRRVTIVVK